MVMSKRVATVRKQHLLGIALASILFGFGACKAHAVTEQAKPADAFVETIGIGDRFDWLNDDGRLPQAQTAINLLHIRYLRVGITAQSGSPTYIANTKAMASNIGAKLCIVTDVYNPWSTQAAWLDSWRAYSGTYAVEGPNEVGSALPTAVSIQQSLWAYAYPKGMEVYAWTLGGQAGYYNKAASNGGSTVGNYCEYLNFHPYHWYTNPASHAASKMNGLWQNGDFDNLGYGTGGCINAVRTMANNPTKPFVSTEFGWCINGQENGVSINHAKKYVPRALFENFNAGMHRGFIFSLTAYAGAGADYSVASYKNGSLNATGQAVADTISLLQEPGHANFAAGALNYSLTGTALAFTDDHNVQNDEIHHTLLQKSNGTYYLVLWCDYDSHLGEDGWSQTGTLTLPDGARSVNAYLPVTNGTSIVTSYGAVSAGGTIRVTIPDHPIILAISGI